MMLGPLSGMLSGQRVAFEAACEAMPRAGVVDGDLSSASKIVTFPFRLILGFISSHGPVYFTSSRSYKGFYGRDLLVILMAWFSGRTLINHLHGNDFYAFRLSVDPLTGWFVDWCYRKIHLSIAPSRRALKQYDRYQNMVLEVVENFFDDSLAETPLKKGDETSLEVVYLSNLIYSKGFTIVVDACDCLRREGRPVHLTLCGAPIGDKNMAVNEIKAYLDGLEGDPSVTIAGTVKGDVKARILSEANVFVLPTTYPTEEAPISILEALAAGCFVVSTDQGSITDMLAGFHGLILPATAKDVAGALRHYWGRNDKMQIAIENREMAKKRYSASAYREKIAQLIESAGKEN